MGQKWSEVAATNTVDGIDVNTSVAKIPFLNEEEVLPENQNQFILMTDFVANILGSLGLCQTFTTTNNAISNSIQDNRLIGKKLSDVRMVVFAGTEIVSLNYVTALDNAPNPSITGTLSISQNYSGLPAIITLA